MVLTGCYVKLNVHIIRTRIISIRQESERADEDKPDIILLGGRSGASGS